MGIKGSTRALSYLIIREPKTRAHIARILNREGTASKKWEISTQIARVLWAGIWFVHVCILVTWYQAIGGDLVNACEMKEQVN